MTTESSPPEHKTDIHSPINEEVKSSEEFAPLDLGEALDINGVFGVQFIKNKDARIGVGEFEFDSGFSGEFGIEYDFGKFRTEFTYNATNTDLTTVQGVSTDIGVDVSTWMASAAYDWRADKKWQPYVSAGIGKSTIEVDLAQTIGSVAVVVDDDDITSAKFKVGVNYEAAEELDIYGEVWGQAFDDFTIGSLEFEDCGMTGVSLGLRYKL